MINLKYTIIDEQHNRITDDEIAITSFEGLKNLKHWFQDYRMRYSEYDNQKTIVVTTMSVIRENNNGECTDVTDYIICNPITSIASAINFKFKQHVFGKHLDEYLK